MRSKGQLPGVSRRKPPPRRPFVQFSQKQWPPWKKKQVVVPFGWTLGGVEWVLIGELIPNSKPKETWQRQMKAPGQTYPALVVNGRRIVNGHHRYYILMDGGWTGLVPVVFVHRPVDLVSQVS